MVFPLSEVRTVIKRSCFRSYSWVTMSSYPLTGTIFLQVRFCTFSESEKWQSSLSGRNSFQGSDLDHLGVILQVSRVNLCFKCEFSTLVLLTSVFLHISLECFNGVLNSSLYKQKQGFSSSCLYVSAEKGVKLISRAMLHCKDVIKKSQKLRMNSLPCRAVSISY